MDSAHKLTILASIAFGIPLDYASVAVEGITRVVPQDIQIAQVFGYRIKLLGIAKRSAAGVELRVHPTLVPDTALLAKVDGVLNSVVVRGDAVGEVGFYGRGAGGDAPASAIGDRKSTRLTPVTNAPLVCRCMLDTKNNDTQLSMSSD